MHTCKYIQIHSKTCRPREEMGEEEEEERERKRENNKFWKQ